MKYGACSVVRSAMAKVYAEKGNGKHWEVRSFSRMTEKSLFVNIIWEPILDSDERIRHKDPCRKGIPG